MLFMSVSSSALDINDDTLEHSVRDLMAKESVEVEVTTVDKLKKMFKKAKISGDLRSIYSRFYNKNESDRYATAVGGSFKYELAEFNGFNAATTFRTTNKLNFASGDGENFNPDLTGSKGSSNELSEAYVNYEYKGLNLRAGRQVIDTPLADSDDIRMAPDSFYGYTGSYEADTFSVMLGHLRQWQGYDAGLDKGWVKTGKNGVNFFGLTYSKKMIDSSMWYYNMSNASDTDILNGADENGNNSFYTDLSGHFDIKQDFLLHLNVQYLHQSELDGSNVKANIYGGLAEVLVDGFSLGLAYNKSIRQKAKHSFSGYGGGTLYTSMDTMILDEITNDRDAQAAVASLSYQFLDCNFLYAYGEFKGDADSLGVKEHIAAHNIVVQYTTKKGLTLGSVYIHHKNKEDSMNTFYNGSNFRVFASYNFEIKKRKNRKNRKSGI